MNEQLMTPAEIERATVERCASLSDSLYAEARADEITQAIRAIPPMFDDSGVGIMQKAIISAYDLPDDSRIDLCVQRDGSHKWAVRRSGACLNHDGEFEFEPMPSGRDDDFIARCRFESAEAAYLTWDRLLTAAPTAGQAAAKDAEPVEKEADGWIKWEGGDCPVPDDTLVEVKFECGDSNRFLHASSWDWSHGDDTGYDIVSYRVLAAAPEVK